MALGLAQASRADAYAIFAAGKQQRAMRANDLEAAERDYAESVAIYTELQQAGSIHGTDLQTLETNRKPSRWSAGSAPAQSASCVLVRTMRPDWSRRRLSEPTAAASTAGVPARLQTSSRRRRR